MMVSPDWTSKHPATVALVTTVHEPDDRLAGMVAAQLPALTSRYVAVGAYCSKPTHRAIIDLLAGHGVSVQVDSGPPTGIGGIGDTRRQTLRLGLSLGGTHLQTCDFDRAIHWAARFPEEMEAVIAEIPHYDLLVLGRTERAWATHPPYQAETEPLFNKVFALVTGLPWDVGAGSRGLSRRAAERILELSKEPTVGIDAEWPLLALRQDGFRIGHRPCEGLEFETADRFGPEIEAAGGYSAWEAQMSADPHRWVYRIQLALMIAESASKHHAKQR